MSSVQIFTDESAVDYNLRVKKFDRQIQASAFVAELPLGQHTIGYGSNKATSSSSGAPAGGTEQQLAEFIKRAEAAERQIQTLGDKFRTFLQSQNTPEVSALRSENEKLRAELAGLQGGAKAAKVASPKAAPAPSKKQSKEAKQGASPKAAPVAAPAAAAAIGDGAEIFAQATAAGDKVRDLKAAKADKAAVKAAVDELLALKTKYTEVTGQPFPAPGQGPAPAAKAPGSPKKGGADAGAALEAQGAAQGEKVRELKAAKADKAAIKVAVDELLAIKKKYTEVTGQPFPENPKGGSVPAAAAAAGPSRPVPEFKWLKEFAAKCEVLCNDDLKHKDETNWPGSHWIKQVVKYITNEVATAKDAKEDVKVLTNALTVLSKNDDKEGLQRAAQYLLKLK